MARRGMLEGRQTLCVDRQTGKHDNLHHFYLLFFIFNPYRAKLNNLNFHPLGVVSRYRGPQLPSG